MSDNAFSASSLGDCFRDLCSEESFLINTDIAGIGIYLSYLIQIGISIGAFLLLSALASWMYYVLRSALFYKGRNQAKTVANRIQKKLISIRLLFIPALEEFHRTQCFFGLASQTAVLIATGIDKFDATNITQIQTLFYFVQTVASNIILSVLFTFWYMRGNTERSWYNYLLTLSTLVLSAVTFYTALQRSKQPDAIISSISTHGPEVCGSSSPKILCVSWDGTPSGYTQIASQYIWPVPIYSLIFMMYFTIDHIGNYPVGLFDLISKFQTGQYMIAWCERLSPTPVWARRLKGLGRRLWIILSLTTLGIFFSVVSTQVSAFSAYPSAFIDTSNWSIGQIIGVTIWAHPVLGFVQLGLGKL